MKKAGQDFTFPLAGPISSTCETTVIMADSQPLDIDKLREEDWRKVSQAPRNKHSYDTGTVILKAKQACDDVKKMLKEGKVTHDAAQPIIEALLGLFECTNEKALYAPFKAMDTSSSTPSGEAGYEQFSAAAKQRGELFNVLQMVWTAGAHDVHKPPAEDDPDNEAAKASHRALFPLAHIAVCASTLFQGLAKEEHEKVLAEMDAFAQHLRRPGVPVRQSHLVTKHMDEIKALLPPPLP